MKGIAEDIGGTLLVLIAVVLVLFAAVIILLAFKLMHPGETPSSSVEFIASVNKAYTIATAIAHYLAYDRQVLEQAVETSVAGSVENSNSEGLASFLRQFLNIYKDDIKFISVSISKDGKEIFQTDTVEDKRCDNDRKGYCSDLTVFTGGKIIREDCGKGRILISRYTISKEENMCSRNEICCKEDDWSLPPWQSWQRCGEFENGKQVGICDYNVGGLDGACLPGRVKIDDKNKECEKLETSTALAFTPPKYVCCRPIATPVSSIGVSSTAEIPLLYKGSLATLEVSVG